MLEQEVAALVQFIRPLKLTEYFGEVPVGAATPSVYYPVPEIEGNEFSLSTFEDSFSLYIKIFDKDTLSSYSIASQIVKMVQSAGKKIPLYDENGVLTGKCFRIKQIKAKNIDVGTTQIYVTWDVHTSYDVVKGPEVKHMNFGGLPIGEESEEESDNG